MNLTKTDLRTSLGDEIFFWLCFIKHTMPSLDAVDYSRLITAWHEKNHDSPQSAARGDADSKVIARLKREKSQRDNTPVGTKKK